VPYVIAFSPDGRSLACGSVDGSITIWNIKSGHVLELAGHHDRVQALAFLRDSDFLVSGGFDNSVRVWEIATGALAHVHRYDGDVMALDLSPNGKTLAVGVDNGSLRLMHLARIPLVGSGQRDLMDWISSRTSAIVSDDGMLRSPW
jgi:WD40 repeat protein